MAIRKRGNSYQVSYRCPGEKTPRTETFHTEDEARIRDLQIKLAKKAGNFEPPERIAKGVVRQTANLTIEGFLKEYVETYGLKKWGHSFYSSNKSLIDNYIIPNIGSRYVSTFTVRDMDEFYSHLLELPAVIPPGHQDTGARVTAHTVARIHKLLKSAFSKAVLWGYTKVNPTTGATLPTAQSEIRAVWSDDEAVHALSVCEPSPLQTCLYLGLGCSMRLGEILGLQWSNVHFSDPQSEISEGYLRVDRELNRISNESMEALERVNRGNILFKFPRLVPKKATTTLVLKEPKTESSKRTIYLPKAVEDELRCVRAQQEEYRRQLGEEYRDYDLVVAQINGHPYEHSIIARQFKRFIEANELRPVVFHSLRHSSTSLKLKLSHGDIKAVQGDTGHAQARMVTDTYAHGFDTDRKMIAREMDAQFFSKIRAGSQEDSPDSGTLDLMRTLAQKYPELLIAMLKGEEPTFDK